MYAVSPSFGDFATASAAVVPAAPARFSTTTAWPRISANGCAINRAEMSVPPPALAPTTRRMGRVGQSWALAEPMLAPRIAIAATETRLPSEATHGGGSFAMMSCTAGPLLGIFEASRRNSKCRPKRDSLSQEFRSRRRWAMWVRGVGEQGLPHRWRIRANGNRRDGLRTQKRRRERTVGYGENPVRRLESVEKIL